MVRVCAGVGGMRWGSDDGGGGWGGVGCGGGGTFVHPYGTLRVRPVALGLTWSCSAALYVYFRVFCKAASNGVTRINIFEPNSPRRVFQQLDGADYTVKGTPLH